MANKTLITTVILSLVLVSSSTVSEAEGPMYDQNGDLILDVKQDDYKDNSTPQENTNGTATDDSLILDQEDAEDRESSSSLYLQQPESSPKKQVKSSTKSASVAAVTTSTSVVPGAMLPASATFMEDSKTVITSKGTQKISKVEIADSVGLKANSWTVLGDTLTFDTAKLNDSSSGIYVFDITFDDGSKSLFELKVLSSPILEDYWQQNISNFSKDKRSNTNKDLELISSTQLLKISSITIDGVTVPSSNYSIIGGTVIISKNYLTTLGDTERARVTVTYSVDRVVDFSLTITDEMEESTTVLPIDC